jgi:hypothetical protein
MGQVDVKSGYAMALAFLETDFPLIPLLLFIRVSSVLIRG